VEIVINGTTREVTDNVSLQQLVANLNLTPERIAVELNREVIRQAQWMETILKAGDRVEIVHFVGGGGSGQ
jgi:sulfur carrier protein